MKVNITLFLLLILLILYLLVIKTVLCLFSHHIKLLPATCTIIHQLNQQINFDSVCYLATFNVNVAQPYLPIPFHAVPSIIAINMIMAGATGGIVAVVIASWAQVTINIKLF